MTIRDTRFILPLVVFVLTMGLFFIESQMHVVEGFVQSATKYHMVLSVDFTAEGMRPFGERCAALTSSEALEAQAPVNEETVTEEPSVE